MKPESPKKKTGLFFGTFNPIHVGHLVIANYMLEFTDLDEVWLVVSPLNPLKEKKSLLADYHRYAMVDRAVEEDSRLKVSNFEFSLPQPSYTIDTLVRLEEKYPDKQFILIAGTDIFPSFHKWKNHEQILANYNIYIYTRPGYHTGKYRDHPHIRFFDAPQMEISSSFIRKAIREGKDVRYFLPEKVYGYIREMHFYEK